VDFLFCQKEVCHIKAALLEGLGKIKMTRLPKPKCQHGEVLVRVMACGICRTDMKAYRMGQRDLRLPRVLGHEITGVVAEVGPKVNCVQPGDRVQIAPGLPCGMCAYCQMGMHNLCDQVEIMGFHYDGGFADYVLIPENGVRNAVLNKIPESLTFFEAALAEPLACCVNMQETAGIQLGDTVVIFGAGPLGILNAKLARKRGASRIILIEKRKSRIDEAKGSFDFWVNSAEEDIFSIIQKVTYGNGVNAAIPCCPDPQAFADSLALLAKKGRLCFFSGLVMEEQMPRIDLNLLHYKELAVFGAYGCSSRHNRIAMELMATGMIQVQDMTTLILPLAELEHGFSMAANRVETNIIIDLTL
jgi:L-iditol 2-dehydrogenase